MEVSTLLDDTGKHAREELNTPVDIEEVEEFPAADDIYIEKRTWKKIENVVVVAADLKGSTKLNFNKYAQTSAQLYEAVTGKHGPHRQRLRARVRRYPGRRAIRPLPRRRPLWARALRGDHAQEFQHLELEPAIEKTMPDRFPETGIKVGMAAGILAVKKVGVRGTNEPVWAGKPVNWATKCAAKAGRSELIVTRKVFQKFENNDYVTHSCGCSIDLETGERVRNGATPSELWSETQVDTLPEDDIDCKLLQSNWCPIHGDEFCTAILEGKTNRNDVLKSVAA